MHHPSSDKARMLAGEPYDANAPDLLAERADCRSRCEHYNALPFAAAEQRATALAEMLGEVGEDVIVMSHFECDYGYQITIGPRSFINYGAVILDAARVSIGANVQIGPGGQLLTALHPLDAARRRTGEETAAPVTLEDDVWLAANVTVLPGVRIGAGTVVGAGSVVTRSLPAGYLCVGNPCRPVRPI